MIGNNTKEPLLNTKAKEANHIRKKDQWLAEQLLKYFCFGFLIPDCLSFAVD